MILRPRLSSTLSRARDVIRRAGIFVVLSCMLAMPAVAQEVTTGRGATSSVGQAGVRQTRDQAAQRIGQTGRLDLRVNSRIQNRIRTRIDRDYAPQAAGTSSYQAASERLRTTVRPRRR